MRGRPGRERRSSARAPLTPVQRCPHRSSIAQEPERCSAQAALYCPTRDLKDSASVVPTIAAHHTHGLGIPPSVGDLPVRRSRSISTPEMIIRAASPMVLNIARAGFGVMRPSTDGPAAMSSRISITITGSAWRGTCAASTVQARRRCSPVRVRLSGRHSSAWPEPASHPITVLSPTVNLTV